MNSIFAMLGPLGGFLSNSPYGFIIIILAVLLLVLLIVFPLLMKLRRKRLKTKETKDIMKDLFTWRHLSQLVKGGDEHNKAKQELSDKIERINELLRQGFLHATGSAQSLYSVPWYMVLGEPLSGKSSLLAASELELVPSTREENPENDPKKSLPLRFWTGAKSVVCDIS
jgi:type VI protein secretion system component VasK